MEYITDVTADTFNTQVVERSGSMPVLVDFWAEMRLRSGLIVKLLGQPHSRHISRQQLSIIEYDCRRTFNTQ